ncbi:Hypothetical predicted protein [Octopus vulgaris]|uniref:Uncharacterized protein n=1 Tax=Octopus vulgaris TaxID=6645 RepID=A0AA36C1D0_OCTVU|nr:Hypothetical predicted protein [Octopus vulgaris]
MTPYTSLVLILCICGSAAGFTLPPEPLQAFMMGSSRATQCQPWLGYAAFGKSYMSNALLIGEDTVLSIQPLYKYKICSNKIEGECYRIWMCQPYLYS